MASGVRTVIDLVFQHPLEAAFLAAAGAFVLLNMSRIFGAAKTNFYYSSKSIRLRTKDGKETTFANLCKSVMPPCRLNPFLFNGHLQTMWTVVKTQDVPIYYKRRSFEQEDLVYNGTFAVDFVVKPYEDSDPSLPPRTTYFTEDEFKQLASEDSKPMLVLLHGLSGGSYEVYLREVLAPLVKEEAGWEACVVNSRGCANSKITSSVLYNARATWDVRQIVRWLRKQYPNRPLYGVGFSLGANIMTNYVGEEGRHCLLSAAVVISNPWTLDVSSLALQRTWLGLNVYSRAMGTNMKKLFEKHRKEIMQKTKVDLEEIAKVKYLHEFDRAVQCPTWGYPTEGAYYRDASSTDSLLGIRIPFLAINAEDDPIAVDEAIPKLEFSQSPYTVLCTTSLGGHLSWFQLGGGRWFAEATAGFFEKMASDVNMEHYAENNPLPEDQALRFPPTSDKPWFDPMRRKMHAGK